jgi:hypothetical protein
VFQATEQFPLFDYLRVPYERVPATTDGPIATLTAGVGSTGGHLGWPSRSGADRAALLPRAHFELEGTPFFAALAPDEVARKWLHRNGRSWTRDLPITDAAGAHVASVWRASDGSVFLPFDPADAFLSYLSERYLSVGKRRTAAALSRGVRRAYYLARPALPRKLQIAMRRRFSEHQARTSFPRFPVEPAVHELSGLVVRLAAEVAGNPIPMLAPWPRPYSWALVLTHDVETKVGYDLVPEVCELERGAGFRSSWNFVPERDYEVESSALAALDSTGFEVGVHGLHHDGRDFDTRRHLQRRLPAMHRYAREWNAVGFRSPSTHRRWEWMSMLDFEYDSSYTDTAPYEPQPGGCCSWLPYRIGQRIVELPITMPQDHTLFEILGHEDETPWIEKATLLREHGGMALMLTHPDYMTDGELLPSYRRFLERYAGDDSAWKPLPREAAAWWRRRADSHLELVDGEWTIVGPAREDGAVVYGGR